MSRHINELVDNVYVLNLEKDLFKYEILKRKLDERNITHQRFLGVSGYEVTLQDRVESLCAMFNEFKNENFYERLVTLGSYLLYKGHGAWRSCGAMGCLFSKRNIIQDAINNKYKKILILQDDIYFHKDFNERIKRLAPPIKSCSLFHLGATEYSGLVYNEKKWIDPNRNYKKDKYSTKERTCGMFGIIVGEEIFSPFMEISKFKCFAADQTMAFLGANKFPKSSWVAYPNLIIPDMTSSNTWNKDSDRNNPKYRAFDNDREDTKWLRKFGWNLDCYDLSEKYYV